MARPDGDARRTEIILAVWHVIARDGMGAVSMRNVAAAAGVSVGRIQYWFTTKNDLLHQSLDAMLSGAQQIHDAVTIDTDEHETLWQLIAHSIPAASKSPGGTSVFYQYVAAAITHPDLAVKVAEAKRGAEAEAARLLRVLRPSSVSCDADARTLVALGDGLAMRVLVGDLSETEANDALSGELSRILANTTH